MQFHFNCSGNGALVFSYFDYLESIVAICGCRNIAYLKDKFNLKIVN